MKTSLFSVSYAGLWGQASLDPPAFIAKAAALGYDAVMLMGKRPHLSPLDTTAEKIATIRAALDRNEIACAVIGGYTDFRPAAAAEVPYIEMQVAYVESLARIAAELGAGIVRVFTAYEAPGHAPHALWKGVVSALKEAAARAADRGVTLAVQNHHDVALHTDALLELLADVDRPNVKAGFDAWSPALRGEDLYEAAKKMAPHTAVTTNADYVRFPRYHYQPEAVNYTRIEPDLVRAVKFGTGCIDYEAFFRGLRDGGFDGIANYEMCSPIRGGGDIENLDAFARHYVEWMAARKLA
ncbi:MAG: sugar phosphate isomerase/epimerase family protein [Planctomycetaceae bacterium]